MAEIPEDAKHLFKEKNFADVSTLMKDGSPQTTPVWIDAENGEVVFNTAEGRVKTRNIERDPRVAVAVHNEQNPYEYVMVRGTAELEREGADEHIDELSKRYLNEDTYPFRQPGEVRVKVRVTPESVRYSSSG